MLCGCCKREVPPSDWDGLYGCCDECAWCQSLGQCFAGEDKPESTICCHGECRRTKTPCPQSPAPP
jgi:hypothetical protein